MDSGDGWKLKLTKELRAAEFEFDDAKVLGMNSLVPVGASPRVPELLTAAGERAGMRFLEFFAANIRDPHTRRAYARAADEFLACCSRAGVLSIAAVQPVHVATWIEPGTRELAASSVKQRLAAIRPSLHWLVPAQAVP